jgi:hypothetical protein
MDVTIRSLIRQETKETPIPKIAQLTFKCIAQEAKTKRRS